jgi:hypothetical protein
VGQGILENKLATVGYIRNIKIKIREFTHGLVAHMSANRKNFLWSKEWGFRL